MIVQLPVPTTVAAGASVDTTSLGARKTVTITGTLGGSIVIEYSLDGTQWVPIITLGGVARGVSVTVAAVFMRARVVNIDPFLGVNAICYVGANSDAVDVAAVSVPATGDGPSTDISGFGDVKTVVLGGGDFAGSIQVDASADGVTWSNCMSLTASQRAQIVPFIAQFVRARRVGEAADPGTPTMTIAGADTSPIGIQGVVYQQNGVTIGTQPTLNVYGASSVVDDPGNSRVNVAINGITADRNAVDITAAPYNAVPDGRSVVPPPTDNRLALQAAFNDAKAQRKILLIPPGSFASSRNPDLNFQAVLEYNGNFNRSGTGDQIQANTPSPGRMTVTDAAGLFQTRHAGGEFVITGSTSNDGQYVVDQFLSATQIVLRGSGIDETSAFLWDLIAEPYGVIMGAGPESEIVYIGDGDNRAWYFIEVKNGNSIGQFRFHDFSIFGNASNLTNLDEQTHGIQCSVGSPPQRDAPDIDVWNMTFIEIFGDSIRYSGGPNAVPPRLVRYTSIINCRHLDNRRSAIGMQSGWSWMYVQHDYSRNIADQVLDFEPTAGPLDYMFLSDILTQRDRSNPNSAIAMSSGNYVHLHRALMENSVGTMFNGIDNRISQSQIVGRDVAGDPINNRPGFICDRNVQRLHVRASRVWAEFGSPNPGSSFGIQMAQNANVRPQLAHIHHSSLFGDTPLNFIDVNFPRVMYCDLLGDDPTTGAGVSWQGIFTPDETGTGDEIQADTPAVGTATLIDLGIIPGVGDQIQADTPVVGTATLTDAAGPFVPDMVGKNLVITFSQNPGGNNGSFPITAVISPTQIEYANPAAINETFALLWSVNLGGGDFVGGMVGRNVTIAGAINPANNGTFPITGFVDASTIEYANPAAVNEGAAGVTPGVFGWTIVVTFDSFGLVVMHNRIANINKGVQINNVNSVMGDFRIAGNDLINITTPAEGIRLQQTAGSNLEWRGTRIIEGNLGVDVNLALAAPDDRFYQYRGVDSAADPKKVIGRGTPIGTFDFPIGTTYINREAAGPTNIEFLKTAAGAAGWTVVL